MLAKTSLALILICGASYLGLAKGFAFATKSFSSAEASSSSSSNSSSMSSGGSVWVTRPDGAEQCAPKSGQSLRSSASELEKAHVRVLSSQKGSDGKLHAQMCGIPSGRTNSFEIPKEDLPKALALGFHEVPAQP